MTFLAIPIFFRMIRREGLFQRNHHSQMVGWSLFALVLKDRSHSIVGYSWPRGYDYTEWNKVHKDSQSDMMQVKKYRHELFRQTGSIYPDFVMPFVEYDTPYYVKSEPEMAVACFNFQRMVSVCLVSGALFAWWVGRCVYLLFFWESWPNHILIIQSDRAYLTLSKNIFESLELVGADFEWHVLNGFSFVSPHIEIDGFLVSCSGGKELLDIYTLFTMSLCSLPRSHQHCQDLYWCRTMTQRRLDLRAFFSLLFLLVDEAYSTYPFWHSRMYLASLSNTLVAQAVAILSVGKQLYRQCTMILLVLLFAFAVSQKLNRSNEVQDQCCFFIYYYCYYHSLSWDLWTFVPVSPYTT